MNEQMVAKFRADFSAAHELLSMFNQAIVDALVGDLGSEGEMLQEILPNVNEIHQRLRELKPTMPDPYVVRIIAYLEEYCELCKTSYANFVRDNTFDIDALAEMAGRRIPQPEQTAAAEIPELAERPQPASVDLLDLGGPPQQPAHVGSPPQKGRRRRKPSQPAALATTGTRGRSQSAKDSTTPAARPPPDLSGFEFADDVDSGGMSNAEFAAFIDQISNRKK
jgi:hypothetical protein